MPVWFNKPIPVTPSLRNSWTDVDVSAYIPSGSPGAILRLFNSSRLGAGDEYSGLYVQVRPNGSTTDVKYDILYQGWLVVGLDSNRIFEAFCEDVSKILYLVGYFLPGEVVFFTNWYSKTPSGTSAWLDINLSNEIGSDTALGAIFYVRSAAVYGLRCNGASSGASFYGRRSAYFMVGLANKICEGWRGSTSVSFYFVGYVKTNASFYVNPVLLSISGAGSWNDYTLPSGAVGAILAIEESYESEADVRMKGDTFELYIPAARHIQAFIPANDDFQIQVIRASTSVSFRLYGYFTYREIQRVYVPRIYGVDHHTILLLHLDENPFVDSSLYGIPLSSNLTRSSTDYIFGGYGISNSGGGYIEISNNPIFNFGYEDWTIDFWMKVTNLSNIRGLFCLFQGTGKYYGMFVNTAGVLRFEYFLGPTTKYIQQSISTNKWYHVAVIKRGTELRVALNGYFDDTFRRTDVTESFSLTGDFQISCYRGSDGNFRIFYGFMDEFRVSRGIARWTSSFHIPLEPYFRRGRHVQIL